MGSSISNSAHGMSLSSFPALHRPRHVGNNYGGEYIEGDASSCNNIFEYAYDVMLKIQNLQSSFAYSQFNDIQKASKRARDTQEMANRMDEVIAKAAKGDDKTREKVPDEVQKYMRDHGITVDGKSIDDYIQKNGEDGALDKGGLQAIKAALDNSAGRDGDMSSQSQLVIQKSVQMLNAAITQSTGLVSKWGDLLQMIAQKTFS